MKAWIDVEGSLMVEAETETEVWALREWDERNRISFAPANLARPELNAVYSAEKVMLLAPPRSSSGLSKGKV